jgi:hypothetical protein
MNSAVKKCTGAPNGSLTNAHHMAHTRRTSCIPALVHKNNTNPIVVTLRQDIIPLACTTPRVPLWLSCRYAEVAFTTQRSLGSNYLQFLRVAAVMATVRQVLRQRRHYLERVPTSGVVVHQLLVMHFDVRRRYVGLAQTPHFQHHTESHNLFLHISLWIHLHSKYHNTARWFDRGCCTRGTGGTGSGGSSPIRRLPLLECCHWHRWEPNASLRELAAIRIGHFIVDDLDTAKKYIFPTGTTFRF